jgi:hypothetical protein
MNMATVRKTGVKRGTGASSARRKPEARAANASKVVGEPEAAKEATPAPAVKAVSPTPTPEQRFRMIEEAAYFLAEKDGFRGSPASYWHAAEKQFEQRLNGEGA